MVSWLLPRHLHQHFYNVYAYCRWSDDLGDEVPDRARALRLLDAWEEELRLIYDPGARPSHPVLIALRETVRAKDIPLKPFTDLLRAFRQDQTVHRYATWDDVLDYCVYSANPVGRLVLYLCGYRDEERQQLSDFTCTALQLANFWQDVSRDLEKGRIYIPLEVLAAHGLTEADIVARRFDERYAALMKALDRAHARAFAAGMPLAERVDGPLRVDIELFSRGGMAVLDAIEATGYNTLEHRPALTKWTKLRLLTPRARLQGFSARRRTDRTAASLVSAHPNWKLTPATPKFGTGSVAPGDAASIALRVLRRVQSHRARVAQQLLSRVFRFAASEKRNALCALYAFMRLVDNVSDEPGDLESKRAGSPGGARCSTKPPRAQPKATRFFPRSPTRSRASRFPRAISTT